jgi:hypothetical protein
MQAHTTTPSLLVEMGAHEFFSLDWPQTVILQSHAAGVYRHKPPYTSPLFFLAVLGFELRAYILSSFHQPFLFMMGFF